MSGEKYAVFGGILLLVAMLPASLCALVLSEPKVIGKIPVTSTVVQRFFKTLNHCMPRNDKKLEDLKIFKLLYPESPYNGYYFPKENSIAVYYGPEGPLSSDPVFTLAHEMVHWYSGAVHTHPVHAQDGSFKGYTIQDAHLRIFWLCFPEYREKMLAQIVTK